MAAKAISVATQLITVPITLHYLGAERYGMWLIISSLVTMLSFADLGIGNGVLATVAAAFGRDDRAEMRAAVSSGFVALGSLAAIILVAIWLAYPHIGWSGFFNVHSPMSRHEAGPAMAVFIACFALSIPSTIVQRVQLGMQRGFVSNIWQCAGSAITLPAMLVAMACHAGLPMLVAVLIGVPLIVNILNSLVFFGFQERGLAPLPRLASRQRIVGTVHDGAYFMAIQLGNAVTAGCVPIVIAHAIGPQFVALYAVPDRALALVVMLVSMYVQPLWPAYREAMVRGDRAWIARMHRRTMVVTLVVASIALVAIGAAMPTLLRLWVGAAIHPAFLLIAGLCLYKVAECAMWVYATLLTGLDFLALQSVLALITAGAVIVMDTLACRMLGVAFVPWAGGLTLILLTLVPIIVALRSLPTVRSPGLSDGATADRRFTDRLPLRLRWLILRRQLRRVEGLYFHLTAVSDASCRFAPFVRIYANARFHYSSIGDYSYVAAGARVAYCDIGKFVSIGPEVMLGGLGRHPTDFLSTHPYFYSRKYRGELGLAGGADYEETPRSRVGNDVWIGARAIVLDGVTIGDGAIVAAGAIVVGDVAPYTIVGGVPAKVLRRRRLVPALGAERADWWDLPSDEREALFARAIGHFGDIAPPDGD